MRDSCYTHQRGLVIMLIFVGVVIATYFSLRRSQCETIPNLLVESNWTVIKNDSNYPLIPLKDSNNKILYIKSNPTGSFDFSINFLDDRKSCVIQPILTYDNVWDPKAYILGNDQVLVVIRNYLSEDRIFSKKAENAIYIVDTKNCTYKNVTVGKFENSEDAVKIIPYYDTFDVVITNSRDTTPKNKVVRYNSEGKDMNVSFALQNYMEGLYKMHSVKSLSSESGFFIMAVNFGDKMTVKLEMVKLNDKYEFVKKYHLADRMPMGFTKQDGRMTVCLEHDTPDDKTSHCLTFDFESNKLTEFELPIVGGIRFHEIEYLRGGGFIWIYQSINPYPKDDPFQATGMLYAQYVSSHGKLDKRVELGTFEAGITPTVFQMKNDKYCVVISSNKDLMTRCVEARRNGTC